MGFNFDAQTALTLLATLDTDTTMARHAASFCDEWALEWSETLDGRGLDSQAWTALASSSASSGVGADCRGAGCDVLGGCRDAVCDIDQARVHDGALVLTSDRRDSVLYTGAVTTRGKKVYNTRDGAFRVCIRATLPGNGDTTTMGGLWPAHWMLPMDHYCDPDVGEMDIMEQGVGRYTVCKYACMYTPLALCIHLYA